MIKGGVPPVVLAVLTWIVSVAAITPLAFAMYQYVERPGRAAGRRLASWFARRDPLQVRYASVDEGEHGGASRLLSRVD